jgi:DNA-binding MarR family transcriptional regulator
MKIRQGYYSEESRDESYRLLLEDLKSLNKSCAEVFGVIVKQGPHSLQEISVITGIKEHLVSARLNDLRKAEYVITDGEKVINEETGKKNILWKLNPVKLIPKQLNIF